MIMEGASQIVSRIRVQCTRTANKTHLFEPKDALHGLARHRGPVRSECGGEGGRAHRRHETLDEVALHVARRAFEQEKRKYVRECESAWCEEDSHNMCNGK